jgi:hypothetical protein
MGYQTVVIYIRINLRSHQREDFVFLNLTWALYSRFFFVSLFLRQAFGIDLRLALISLDSPGWPQPADPPTSASWVLTLQVYTTVLSALLQFLQTPGRTDVAGPGTIIWIARTYHFVFSCFPTLFFLFVYYCAGWEYIVAFIKFLQCINYIIPEFTPFIILLYYPLSLTLGTVSTGIIFPFTYMCAYSYTLISYSVQVSIVFLWYKSNISTRTFKKLREGQSLSTHPKDPLPWVYQMLGLQAWVAMAGFALYILNSILYHSYSQQILVAVSSVTQSSHLFLPKAQQLDMVSPLYYSMSSSLITTSLIL